MAELADALDSGSSEGNFMQVQVLLPAPKIPFTKVGGIFTFSLFTFHSSLNLHSGFLEVRSNSEK